jgi:GR25 family glycosyltransferase involved in LPS biosynthesis
LNFYCINTASDKEKWAKAKAKFDAEGIHVTRFNGWDNRIAGLRALFPYERDAPHSGYLMGERQVGIYLSHWMLWNYLTTLPHDQFFIFEDDVKFEPGWKENWHDGLACLPADWDLFYVGSCCLEGWPDNVRYAENIWKTSKAQCLHAYMIRAKALPVMLEKTQKVWAPIDLALLWECQPHLNVYARLPRLMSQENTELPP